MKFIHLADLHLGKSIHGVSMIENQDQVVWRDRFLEHVEEWRPEAVVIAGDIYDRSAPSGEAVMLLDSILTALERMDIPVLMVAGNHDSGQRLSFGSRILEKRKVHIAGTVTEKLAHVTFPDPDGYGPVTFWLMPYLFPALAAQKLGDDSINDYDTAVRRLLEHQQIDFTARNVLIAHQNVTAGGREAERGGSESMVGGVGQIEYTAFDGFDYVALGHIHSSYHVGRREVRYAGSPLCYHFKETKQPAKGPLLVELGEKGTEPRIETKVIEPLHRLRELKGTAAELKAVAEQGSRMGEYVRIVVTDQRITPQLAEFFRELFRKRDSIVMELVSEFQEYQPALGASAGHREEQKPVEEYFAQLYRERRPGQELEEPQRQLLHCAGELVRAGQGAAVTDQEARRLLDYLFVTRKEGVKE